jgi:hypothetical protein
LLWERSIRDEARLKQLIEEARTKKLGEFRRSLEEAISKELCDLLEMSYTITKPEGVLKATFSINNETWEIWPQPGGPATWRLSHSESGQGHRPSATYGFNTEDDLLWVIGTLMP